MSLANVNTSLPPWTKPQAPFYRIWSPQLPNLPLQREHQSRDEAVKEAEWLSRDYPGRRFYVMAPVVSCETPDPSTVFQVLD